MSIKWNKIAIKQLLNIIQFIEENDFDNYSELLENDILKKIKDLPATHSHQSPDRFKTNNDGSYRAFEIDRYRISFRVLLNEIRILQIRHTSRLPRQF
ncbi:type II toxin-antitoxin system RelE/ParE family toxin [Dyadobacter psychrotolerans]|uniref:Type II toxin-antitoxin system RelE/ParE family toxin n=1 Tax=Dyadobacter psychrotolerans TaxID=2541721 RepID=A0A4R5DI31_9BACT|nr:type II toxin-antitoxin system RelE/ParE family toxin [Dyadobacter psychrotolerans]